MLGENWEGAGWREASDIFFPWEQINLFKKQFSILIIVLACLKEGI